MAAGGSRSSPYALARRGAQYFYKPLDWAGRKTAVLLMNHLNTTADLTLSFADVPGLACSSCKVRDLWKHADLGAVHDTFTAANVGAHDAAFLVLTPA